MSEQAASAVPAGVGRTALGVALIRAMESRRPDRLFDDPYAAAFLAAAPGVFERFAAPRRGAAADGPASFGAVLAAHTTLRTRFYDDYLLAATGRDGLRQVVLVAAGLDTRAYRLAWPDGVRLFELDLPEVLRFKAGVLAGQGAAARCERVAIPVDLRGDWAGPLAAAGHRPDEPTAWLVEGLLIYLSADDAARLLSTAGDLSAAGSQLASEHEDLDAEPMRVRARALPSMAEYTAMWNGGLPAPAAWLAEHGWRPTRHDRGAVATGYGRPLPYVLAGGFLTATRP